MNLGDELVHPGALVQQNGEHIYTTTLALATHFSVPHKNVMRSITRLVKQILASRIPDDFVSRNFHQTTRDGVRLWHLTGDGFRMAMRIFKRKPADLHIELLSAFSRREDAVRAFRVSAAQGRVLQ